MHVGGRSLSIDTAVADPALWMQKFGIDVDHVDQMELVRRAEIELASPAKINKAMDYLKKHVKKIHYTAPDAKMKNTEELTRRAVALYYGMISLIEEFGYDFAGIKGQRELTEHYATSDIAEAFLNDYYGPDGTAHDPFVVSTEADMDAALTMEVFQLITGQPVLFADLRSYYPDKGVWDLCNSGAHATYFAGKSKDPAVNLKNTEFRPEGFYYPAGGPSVYHIARPGEVTLARLTRSGSTTHYKMVAVHGEFVSFGAAGGREAGGDRAGQLAARIRQVRLRHGDIHPGHELQPHPWHLRQLDQGAEGVLRGGGHRVREPVEVESRAARPLAGAAPRLS